MVSQTEIDQQLFLDGLQPVDVQRLRGDIQQQADRNRIQQLTEQLGERITRYAQEHREMPRLRQVNGVDQNGLPIVEFRI